MTVEQVRDMLHGIRIMRAKAESIFDAMEELQEQATAIRSAGISDMKVQTMPENSLERLIAEIDLKEREFTEAIRKLNQERNRVRSLIFCLKDDRYIQILSKRYIDLKKWKEVADETGYELAYTIKIGRKAVQAMAESISLRELKGRIREAAEITRQRSNDGRENEN